MFSENDELRAATKKAFADLHVKEDRFSRIMSRLEKTNTRKQKQTKVFRVVFPALLSFVLMLSMVFPVLGNESNLLDVYQNYRLQKSFNTVKRLSLADILPGHHFEIRQYAINTLLEKDFHLTPVQIQHMVSQNLDNHEMIGLAMMTRMTKRQPDFLIEQKKKTSWVRMLRKNKIAPQRMIHEIRSYVQSYETHPIRIIFLRGTVDAYSPESGFLVLDGVPFKIFILPDTLMVASIQVGMDIIIEAAFLAESQKVGALSIRSFNPANEGFVILSGKVIQRDKHVVSFQDERDLIEKQILLAPHIMNNPANLFIQAGQHIRFVTFPDPQQRLVAIRFRLLDESFQPPRNHQNRPVIRFVP